MRRYSYHRELLSNHISIICCPVLDSFSQPQVSRQISKTIADSDYHSCATALRGTLGWDDIYLQKEKVKIENSVKNYE